MSTFANPRSCKSRVMGRVPNSSTRLLERAVQLGWPRERVEIIDEDLGKSGADALRRGGFQYLLAEISLARAGLVLSYDASRLARNNRDWYQLLEVCSIFGTLIADGERLYDPRLYHDRLLLGLSGMRSLAELHQLKQRMQAGARDIRRTGRAAPGIACGTGPRSCRRPDLDS